MASIYMNDDTLEKIDALVEQFKQLHPYTMWSRSSVIKVLIESYYDTMEEQ